jgi:N-terminal domain of galactosyltransferase
VVGIRAQNVLKVASSKLRSFLGVAIKDSPRYASALWGGGQRYLTLCNRYEHLLAAPDGSGYRCNWEWTSDLHAPTVVPAWGGRLLRLALRDHPILCRKEPSKRTVAPDVSFIIGHRGVDRLPHLLKTLESIAGQQDAAIECIVVEQDVEARLPGRLPAWVRYLHTPPPAPEMPYCRAWAFNVATRHARSRVLVLHDNDLMISSDYAKLALERLEAGYDVVDLKRFVFYLSEVRTHQLLGGQSPLEGLIPQKIVQNLLGGCSVVVYRSAYLAIGGMDEGFIGWGGEDNEFWERVQTLRVWPYGCVPLLHLWHPVQAGKHQPGNPALARHRMLTAVAVGERIERLRQTVSGAMSGPVGWDEKQTRAS